MNSTILLVDDEPGLRASVQRVLRREQYSFLEADNGRDALDVLRQIKADLVLLDLQMPTMDGFEFLREFRRFDKERTTPVCVMTGTSAARERARIIDLGADDFIQKPAELVELKTRIKSLLRVGAYQRELAKLNNVLEARVAERTKALQETVGDLEAAKDEINLAYREMVLRLSLAAEMKDECTAGHLERMSQYAALLANKIGWEPERVELLTEAAKMHDIGKLGIPDAILNKPGKLTDEEFRIMQSHTEIGARILAGSKSQLLQMASDIAISHHERYDGSGYPRRLSGSSIPEVGRIVAIADVFDALMSKRSYKSAWSLEETVGALKEEKGSHFDPYLVDQFLEEIDVVCSIHSRFADEP